MRIDNTVIDNAKLDRAAVSFGAPMHRSAEHPSVAAKRIGILIVNGLVRLIGRRRSRSRP